MKSQKYYLKKLLTQLPPFQAVFRATEAETLSKYKLKEPILDIGCGDGIFSEVFLDKKKLLYGLDLDKRALKEAEKRKRYIQIIKADTAHIPFSKDKFGGVLANSSLEHIKKVEPVLKEIFRVLRKDGLFLLSAPSEKRKDYYFLPIVLKRLGLKKAALKMGEAEDKFFRHFNCWSGEKWKRELKKIGFNKIEYTYKGSREICILSDLLLPFSIVGYFERLIFGHYLPWRKYIAPFAYPLLKKYEDKVEQNKGAVIIVKAEK